jgi:hypothetical protein
VVLVARCHCLLNRCLDKQPIGKENMRFVTGFFKSALSVAKTVQPQMKVNYNRLFCYFQHGLEHGIL